MHFRSTIAPPVLATSFSIAFMAYGIRYTYSMLLPGMMAALSMDSEQAGLVYTSFLTSYVVASLFVGFLVDIADLRRVILAFLPLFGLGTMLMGLVGSAPEAALAFGLAGVGASVGWTPLVLWVQRAYPNRRGSYLGLLQMGCNLGFGTLGIAAPLMEQFIMWRGVWLILGGASILWLMPMAALTRGSIEPPSGGRRFLDHMRGFGTALGDSRFWIGGTSYMLASYAIMTPLAFTAAYATSELGIGRGEAAMLFSVLGFVGLVGALGIPALSDSIGRGWTLALADSIIAVSLVGSALLARSFQGIAMWSAAMGVGYGAIWPLYAALVKDLYGWDIAGGITGMWTVMGGMGLLLSPAIGGYMADALASYRPAYLTSAVIAAIAAALAVASTYRRRRAEGASLSSQGGSSPT